MFRVLGFGVLRFRAEKRASEGPKGLLGLKKVGQGLKA